MDVYFVNVLLACSLAFWAGFYLGKKRSDATYQPIVEQLLLKLRGIKVPTSSVTSDVKLH